MSNPIAAVKQTQGTTTTYTLTFTGALVKIVVKTGAGLRYSVDYEFDDPASFGQPLSAAALIGLIDAELVRLGLL